MGENRQSSLLHYMVKESGKWIKAQKLADMFEVSTRQIRKYIVAINEKCSDFSLIESGSEGYRLDGEKYFPYKEKVDRQKADTPQMRQNYMIQKLIALKDGYDIFDFSDELFVSVATIENDLKSVRKTLEGFGLALKRNKDMLFVLGGEKEKRLLMRNMILPNSYDFALNDEIQLLTFHYHFWDFRKNIWRILVQDNDLFSNDYTLNNIALHVIVMIDRLRNGANLEQPEPDIQLYQDTEQFTATKQLAEYLCSTYDIEMTDAELYQLFLTVSHNTTVVDHSNVNIDNIKQSVEQKYIDIAENVLDKVERTYYLDPFDDDFKTRFIIHVSNLFNRIKSDYSARNPLTAKMKGTYPLIYDIAVYVAQEFENDYGIHLTEDEIAFIALHIGGYFENNLQNMNKVSCTFIYTDYYGNYKKTIEKISRIFSDSLYIKHIVSLSQYLQEKCLADLIISTVEMEFSGRYTVINPILTNDNIENIRMNVESILKRNQYLALKTYFSDFIDSKLFYKNPDFKNKNDAITKMTQNAISLGLAKESLTENVLQRESLSDTGFNGVAVPHSLREDVMKSFISFAICDTPMEWGAKQVYIIALIGVNQDSRKAFTEVFDFLVDVLSEMQNVKELASSADYDDFFQKLTTQVEKISY
ncbi:BglG family transcription antiterminator [Anaerocolumna xylanovorans]|uniref:Lichenan operon transcriptional antiterminator n=1 Tax=Anaerocolumna xylanovorans DSM 12503 TaxID=1121345 RepID=A0A1M7YBR3_9FIRM|nr:BglG family transcription antiterminator [Anaerocolumna xylanovorans]SHO50016.1 lichenan operon transcriptional antiterminator [Anaerocolumna xylanovorans DSM 12503]